MFMTHVTSVAASRATRRQRQKVLSTISVSFALFSLVGLFAFFPRSSAIARTVRPLYRMMGKLVTEESSPPPWLNLAVHVKNPLPSGIIFTTDDVFPDASAIAGSGFLPGSLENTVEYVTLADSQEHPLLTLPSDVTEPEVVTDGRFIAWVSGKGVAGRGQNKRQLAGYFDTTNGQTMTIPPTAAYGIDPYNMAADHQQLLFNTSVNNLIAIDMATGLGSSRTVAANVTDLITLQISWPYVLYATGDLVAHLYNLTTYQDLALPQVQLNPLCMGCVALAGTTVFWTKLTANGSTTDAQINEIDHADQPGATSHLLTTVANVTSFGNMSANDRLILWTDSDIQVWDRKIAQLYDVKPYHNALFAGLGIHGNGFYFPTYGSQTISVNIIDTTQIPG